MCRTIIKDCNHFRKGARHPCWRRRLCGSARHRTDAEGTRVVRRHSLNSGLTVRVAGVTSVRRTSLQPLYSDGAAAASVSVRGGARRIYVGVRFAAVRRSAGRARGFGVRKGIDGLANAARRPWVAKCVAHSRRGVLGILGRRAAHGRQP